MPILQTHKTQIDEALKCYHWKSGTFVTYPSNEDDKNWECKNIHLIRLRWLEYWVNWALENCQYPIFNNG
jgi:hypothetical protein